MRILIIHNILWAHYKASVFQALQRAVDQRPDLTLKVLQIARNERSRAGLETSTDPATPIYSYEYELLFDRFAEDISLRERTAALLQHVRAFRPDVINLTGYYDPAQILVLLWAKANRVRVVMQNESTAADHQRGFWKEQFKRWIFGQCDGFFCFGNQSADYLIRLGVSPKKILLRKNAVDNNKIRSVYEQALPTRTQQQRTLGLRPNNVIFVGRLLALKNLPTLLSSFAEARQQSLNAADWGLILLGDGPEEALLKQKITELGIGDVVKLLPGRPWFRVAEVLALSNVLVLPSTSETWGLVVNEAMVCGLPVIVSNRCGCVPDLVHDGQNGFVFDPSRSEGRIPAGAVDSPGQSESPVRRSDTSAELTHHLTQFINGNVDVDRMARSARELVAPYAPEAVAQEMLAGFIDITT